MKVAYKINKTSFFEPIKKSKWIYLTFIFYFGITFYFIENFKVYFCILIFLLIPFILQIILHLNYYFHDKDRIIEIDYREKILIQTKNKVKTVIHFEDINKIYSCKGSRYAEKYGKYVIPSNFYNYTVVVDVEKKKIRFTDFILKDFGLFPAKKSIIITPFLNLTPWKNIE